MTETLGQKIAALEPSSELAQELSTIDLDKYMKQDIEKVCEAASMEEIMKIAFLGTKLRIATGQEEEIIKGNLKTIADELLARLESNSITLDLPKCCLDMLFDVQ